MSDRPRTVTRARAFGPDLQGGFGLPGFAYVPVSDGPRPLRLDLAAAGELDERWDGTEGERISEISAPDGRPLVTIDRAPDRGYRIWAEDFGRAWIAQDGQAVLCAPVDLPPW